MKRNLFAPMLILLLLAGALLPAGLPPSAQAVAAAGRPWHVRAQPPTVVLNEFVAKATEWIELYNPTDSDVDLLGWNLSSAYGLLSHTFTQTVVVPAGGYYVYYTGGTFLHNDGDVITLTNAAAIAVDVVGCGMRGGAPLPPVAYSSARTPNGNDTDYDAGDWNLDDTPTQGAANDAAGVSLGSSLILNEFDNYPPTGENDKVEIYNPSDAPISMAGWFLSDGDAVAPIVTAPTVPARGWLVLEENVDWTATMDFSSSDVGYLFLPDGTRVDQIGWYDEWEDNTFQRICDGDGVHDGYNWASSDGGKTFQDLPQTLGSSNCVDAAMGKAGPAFVGQGQRITYTLSFGMLGPEAGQNLRITDTLPADVTFVTYTSLLPVTLTASPNPLVFDAGSLSGYTSTSIWIIVDVAGSVPLGTRLTNTVQLACNGDNNLGNNSDSFTSIVVESETSLDKAGPGLVLMGAPISYTLIYQVYADPAQGMVITDVLPAAVTYVSDTAPVVPTQPVTGTLVWDMGTRSSGSFVVYGLVSNNPMTWTIRNQAWITATNDTFPDNNYAYWDTQLPIPIQEIEYAPNPPYVSPYAGQWVWTVGAVIVDESTFGTPNYRIFIQDPYGDGPWDGLYLYYGAQDAPDVNLGDLLLVGGIVQEYYFVTELSTDLTHTTVLSTGVVVNPTVLQTADLITGTVAESYESVLAQFDCVTVTNPNLGSGNWGVTDASGEEAVVGSWGTYAYSPTLGDRLDPVRGLVNYYSGLYKIEPRGDGDIAYALFVDSTDPADGATDVPIVTNIQATFNMSLTASTVSTATFYLEGPGGILVPGTVSYVAGSTTATFDPAAYLTYTTAYVAHLTTGMQSFQGLSLCEEYTWSFTTAGQPVPDLTPSIKIADPAGVQPGAALTYTIFLYNAGDANADATITDVVPLEVSVITPTLPPGLVYSDSLLLWSGLVATSTQVPLVFQARANTDLVTGQVITNMVWINDGVHGPFTRTAVAVVLPGPDIAVDPTVLNVILNPGGMVDRFVNVGNLGDADLVWSLAENPAQDWLSESPTMGTVLPAEIATITVSFDATGLSADTYTTTLEISSNDPDEPLVAVEVTLVVTTGCIPVTNANFTWTPVTPTVGQPVTFRGTAEGLEPISFTWSFGDGGTGSGAIVNHTYTVSDTYTVLMTATNACNSDVATHLVRVVAPPQQRWTIYLPVIFKGYSTSP